MRGSHFPAGLPALVRVVSFIRSQPIGPRALHSCIRIFCMQSISPFHNRIPPMALPTPLDTQAFFAPGDRLSARADHQNLLWWPPTAPKRRVAYSASANGSQSSSSLLHSAFLNGSGGRRGRSRLLEARMFGMYGPSTSTAIRLKGIVRKYLEYDAIICWPFPPTNQPLCISLWQPY